MTTTIHPSASRADRLTARTVSGLAAFGLAATVLTAPFTVSQAHHAGAIGQGAGRCAVATALVFAVVFAVTVWPRLTTDRRTMRTRPLAASAVALALADVLAVQAVAQAVAGNARFAALGIGYVLWTSVLAAVLFGIASLPIADQDTSK